MMNRIKTVAVALTVGALTTVLGATAQPMPASAGNPQPAIGLTSTGRLVSFDLTTPQRVRSFGAVRGLAGDAALFGIDIRVQDGKLYGVGEPVASTRSSAPGPRRSAS
jgi:hypothetical protein